MFQDMILKYGLRLFLEIIKKAITAEQFTQLMDSILDMAEDFVDKETSLDIADPFFRAALEQLRLAINVPDTD